jgi:predicted O-linked N-acetylglucosamine transferase (SPINDLY family)
MLSIDLQIMKSQFESGDFMALSESILAILDYFEREKLETMPPELQQNMEVVTKLILYFFASETFAPPPQFATRFIALNTVLANMIRLTNFGNADIILKAICKQPNNLIRMLTLYSPYCRQRLDIDDFFKVQPYLTSYWVATVLKSRWFATAETHAFIQELLLQPALRHYAIDDRQFPIEEETAFAYFHATYADPDKDRKLRDVINACVQKTFRYGYQNPAPDFRRILVISANMSMSHPIYRCLAPMLHALKPDYHLTLFHINPSQENKVDRVLFDEVINYERQNIFTQEMLENILHKNFGVAIFSDIGLNRPSLIMANLRLAPIQITTYGHPVSSGDTQIDYFIGGEDVEPTNAQRFFSEKLRLIPGLGVEPVYPDYTPQFPPKAYEWIEIGLSWGELKYNYPHLMRLKKIQEQVKKPLRFHFIGISATRLTFINARKDLQAMFGESCVHVSPFMPNADYMRQIEACDVLLDSFHFGSYTRVVDSLYCHKPMVALMGDRSYNRLAGALLRQAGFPELVAATTEEYVSIAVRLIEDEEWRDEIVRKIKNTDLDARIFHSKNAQHFKSTLDTIVKEHTEGKARGK